MVVSEFDRIFEIRIGKYKLCKYCDEIQRPSITCCHDGCSVNFHPRCAKKNGLIQTLVLQNRYYIYALCKDHIGKTSHASFSKNTFIPKTIHNYEDYILEPIHPVIDKIAMPSSKKPSNELKSKKVKSFDNFSKSLSLPPPLLSNVVSSKINNKKQNSLSESPRISKTRNLDTNLNLSLANTQSSNIILKSESPFQSQSPCKSKSQSPCKTKLLPNFFISCKLYNSSLKHAIWEYFEVNPRLKKLKCAKCTGEVNFENRDQCSNHILNSHQDIVVKEQYLIILLINILFF